MLEWSGDSCPWCPFSTTLKSTHPHGPSRRGVVAAHTAWPTARIKVKLRSKFGNLMGAISRCKPIGTKFRIVVT